MKWLAGVQIADLFKTPQEKILKKLQNRFY